MKKLIALLLVACTLLCFSGCGNQGMDYTKAEWTDAEVGPASYQVPTDWGEPDEDYNGSDYLTNTYTADTFQISMDFMSTEFKYNKVPAYENAVDYKNFFKNKYEDYKDGSVTTNYYYEDFQEFDDVKVNRKKAQHYSYVFTDEGEKTRKYYEVYSVDMSGKGRQGIVTLRVSPMEGKKLTKNARKAAEQLLDSIDW